MTIEPNQLLSVPFAIDKIDKPDEVRILLWQNGALAHASLKVLFDAMQKKDNPHKNNNI